MNEHDFVIRTVQEAGKRLLKVRDQGFDTATKNDDPQDIVTSADKEVNAFIIEAIRSAFPDDKIYSEEGGGTESSSVREWTIDPIDGSSNFSRGIPHFAVCLGLLEAGVPTVGAIYNPITSELFSFEKGTGAYVNGKQLHVSEKRELKDAMIFFRAGHKSGMTTWGGESYQKLLESANKTSNFGSSSLDICFLAAGRIEAVVYGTLNTLDIAPAIALLKEAGGVISTAVGEDPAYTPDRQRIYLANNQPMLDSVRNLLES